MVLPPLPYYFCKGRTMIERILKARKNVLLKSRINIYDLELGEVAVIQFENLKEYQKILGLKHVVGPATPEELAAWQTPFFPVVPSKVELIKEETNVTVPEPLFNINEKELVLDIPFTEPEKQPIPPVWDEVVKEKVKHDESPVCPICGKRKSKRNTYCKKCTEKLEKESE